MSGWMADMAEAFDVPEAAQAPPQSKASMPSVCPDDAPTEPATSPRTMEVPVRGYIHEIRLPTREYGPQEEPEKFVTRWVVNDGSYTVPGHQLSILMQSLQGLVHHCNLHHLQQSDPLKLKA